MNKLSDYAREHHVTYRTAYNHFKQGLIYGAYQLPTGTVVIPDNKPIRHDKEEYIITYARVSSSENKDNLESQSKRLIQFCNAKGWITKENVKEIGSSINDNRKRLLKILQEGKVTKLVIENKDRLTRFGFNFIKTICDKINCEIIIINNVQGEQEDLIQDFISIITSYGYKTNKCKVDNLIKQLEEDK
jgi:predicted site-specific integrase-resolvase